MEDSNGYEDSKRPLLSLTTDSLDLNRLRQATKHNTLKQIRDGTPTAPFKVSFMLTPEEVYEYFAYYGYQKTKLSAYKTWVLAMVAGAYIGVAFAVTSVGAGQLSPMFRIEEPGVFNILYGLLFPIGLALIIFCGAELFTSNVCYMTTAFWEGKVSWDAMAKNLLLSYFGNLAGALCFSGLLMGGDVFGGRESFIVTLAQTKVDHPFSVNLCRAILANWLVCLAVWQANAAQDVAGKILAMWLPIFAFVALGFEHCVANMFLIPYSMMLGSQVSVGTFIARNLVPVTIGNFIGGGFFCATVYAFCYGRPNQKLDSAIQSASERAALQVAGHKVRWAGASEAPAPPAASGV